MFLAPWSRSRLKKSQEPEPETNLPAPQPCPNTIWGVLRPGSRIQILDPGMYLNYAIINNLTLVVIGNLFATLEGAGAGNSLILSSATSASLPFI